MTINAKQYYESEVDVWDPHSLKESKKILNNFFLWVWNSKASFIALSSEHSKFFVLAILLPFVTYLSMLTFYMSSGLAKALKTYSA